MSTDVLIYPPGDDLEFIVARYGVPAVDGAPVTVDGRAGRIAGAANYRLLVVLGDDPEPVSVHPTWRVTYHTGPDAEGSQA